MSLAGDAVLGGRCDRDHGLESGASPGHGPWPVGDLVLSKRRYSVNSSLINKIDKAKRYEHEPERIKFRSLDITFTGENDVHDLSFGSQGWQCNCGFFGKN